MAESVVGEARRRGQSGGASGGQVAQRDSYGDDLGSALGDVEGDEAAQGLAIAAFGPRLSPSPRLVAKSVLLMVTPGRVEAMRASRCHAQVAEGPSTPSQTASM